MSKRSRRRNKHKAVPNAIRKSPAAQGHLPTADDILEKHVTDTYFATASTSPEFKQQFAETVHRMANPNKSHSIGYRDNVRKGDIARQLLNFADKVVPAEMPDGDWPLIDLVQNATFRSDSLPGVTDKYRLRELLRKAHCFTIDAPTSALVADFSVAIAKDLDAARRMAIPPFPVTWFELENKSRMARTKAIGVKLVGGTAANDAGDINPRVGWLISPAKDLGGDGYYLTYFADDAIDVMAAPMSFYWHTGEPTIIDTEIEKYGVEQGMLNQIMFGVDPSGVGEADAFPTHAPFQFDMAQIKSRRDITTVVRFMEEISGELRHLFGLLIALSAGQLGAATEYKPQSRPQSAPFEQKGKTLLPLEHKVLSITLSKRTTPAKVSAQAIFHAKKRWHEVRGHWRTLKNEDGSVRKRVPVKAHERGEKKLGEIHKTYEVHK